GFSSGRNQDLVARNSCDANELCAVCRFRKPPATSRARLDEGLEAESHAVAIARHAHRVHVRNLSLLAGGDVPDYARIEAQRADDFFAVLQLEEALNRFAVTRGRR